MDVAFGTNLRGTNLRGRQNQKMLHTRTLLKTRGENFLGSWEHLFPPQIYIS